MKMNSFTYVFKEGFKGLFRNAWYTLASVATISVCLFLTGTFVAILMNFQHIIDNVQKGVAVTVFFEKDTTEEEMKQLQSQIAIREEVDHVEFVSADQAWEEWVEKNHWEEYLDGFPDNPLANSANLKIYINDASRQPDLVTYLESVSSIRRINKSELAAATLSGLDNLAGVASMGIIGLLFLVSVFLINNTIIMGISARKEEINIMKYIGATDFFVRFPFVIEGTLIGLVGALLPLAIIYVLYNRIIDVIVERFSALSSLLGFLDVSVVFHSLAPLCLLVGVGMGFLCSSITCRKHLNV